MVHQLDVNCKRDNGSANSGPNMKRAALWYARKQGLHIFPCHTPLFDHPKGYLCSCEQYRHSAKCKTAHPHLYLEDGRHCEHPGKHPRGSRMDENGDPIVGLYMATNDVSQIEAWWDKYPEANIGWVPGRDGMAVLDADSYKDEFGGTSLTRDQEETPTQISGSGGSHLVFKKHDGAIYSNAAGTLPAGLDVRADNGYIILAPSLHKSGNRYQWELGYGLHEMEPQLLPESIHNILVEATEKSGTVRDASGRIVKLIEFGGVGEAPDVSGLPSWLVAKLETAVGVGKRSEHDYSTVCDLIRMGLSDDEIHAIFYHFPIGREGKYAEAAHGERYLARTIVNARAKLPDPTLGTGVAVRDLVKAARDWASSADSVNYLRGVGVRRAADTAKVLIGLVMAAAEMGAVAFVPGLRKVAFYANVSQETARRQLEKLADADVIELEKTDAGYEVKLVFVRSILCVTVTRTHSDNEGVTLTHSMNWQEEHVQSDLFTALPYRYGIKRRLQPSVLMQSLGPAALLMWRELLDAGMTAGELAKATGLSVDSCKRSLRKMLDAGVICATGTKGNRHAKIFSLVDDVDNRATEILPVVTGYGTGIRNEEVNARLRASHLDELASILKENDKAGKGTPDTARKIMYLKNREYQLRDYADVLVDQLDAMGIKPKKHWRPLVDNRWDKEEEALEAAAAIKAWNELGDAPKNERARMMQDAGWSLADINVAIKASHRLPSQPVEVDPVEVAEQAEAERVYAVAVAELAEQARAADWRTQYKQVLTLANDTYFCQNVYGGWEHLNGMGMPVVGA